MALDSGAGRQEHLGRDERLPEVGPARLPIGQPAGWVRRPPGARLDGMTTDTAVLPADDHRRPAAARAARLAARQLGVDTALLAARLPRSPIAAFVVVVTGLAVGAGLLVDLGGRRRPRRDPARRPGVRHRRAGLAARRPRPPGAAPGLPRAGPEGGRCAS